MTRRTSNVEADSIGAFVDQWRDERPDLDPWPLAILGRAERISSLLQRRSAAWLQPLGLTWESFCLIITLRRQGPPYALRPTDLYRESLLSSGTITNRIDRVEQMGWVVRRRDPADGRAVMVVLTASGRALANRAIKLHLASLATAMAAIAPADRARLVGLLSELLSLLES